MAKNSSGGAKQGKNVTVGPHPDGWQVKKHGNERATAVTETKKEAEKIGRDQARKEHSELIIKGADGKIQSKDSHGNDPSNIKG